MSDLHPSGLAAHTVRVASAVVDHLRTSLARLAVTLLPYRGPSAAFAFAAAFHRASGQQASSSLLGQVGHLAPTAWALATSAAGLPALVPPFAVGLLRFRSYLNQTVLNLITPTQ